MNIKQKLSILAVSFLLVNCTGENVIETPTPDGSGTDDDIARREVQLTLKNKLSLASAKTKRVIRRSPPPKKITFNRLMYTFSAPIPKTVLIPSRNFIITAMMHRPLRATVTGHTASTSLRLPGKTTSTTVC